MSFLVLFNSDHVTIDMEARSATAIEGENIVVLGKSRQTAFIWADSSAALLDSDGRNWIVGRVRLDGRDALCADLHASPTDSDGLLCLRSYTQWGEEGLKHLQGDFCFAIWDEHRQQLFCARDQLGVKPLFYAHAGNRWFVSDALESIRSNSKVGSELDDYWVADFLTTGFCLDVHRSVYKEIKRVPPAHVLIASSDRSAVYRYWTLEIDAPIFYRDAREYLDHFHELLALSIQDRLPQAPVGISMSGGLNSSTLAAKTVAVTGDASRVFACTRYFEHLIHDEEKHFSSLVAKRLGIRLALHTMDETCYDPFWETRDLRTPEPTTSITRAAYERVFGAEMAKEAQVWFFGEGPDNALTFEWKAYLHWLLDNGYWARIGGAIVQYLCGKQAREWRTTIEAIRSGQDGDGSSSADTPPVWMDDTFVKKVDLSTRMRGASHTGVITHPWRPRAFASFTSSIWPAFLEGFDVAVSGVPIEWRHPYLDLRVLKFMLSVPPIPWARRKLLIRKAMRGALPGEILSRDKAPLADDLDAKMLQKYPLRSIFFGEATREFVNEAKVPSRPGSVRESRDLIKLRALDFWLRNR